MSFSRRSTIRLAMVLMTVATLFLCAAASAQRGRPYLDTSLGYNILRADDGSLLRGVSLSFDGGDPWGSLPVNLPSQESLNSLAQDYGLNTVHVYLEGDAAQNPDPAGVNMAVGDDLVARTKAAGLYLIITIGCNGENGSINSMEKTLNFWNIYAPRYANETHVIFEAHNEPVAYTPGHWSQEDWDKQVIMYDAIRAHAPDTFIMLGSFMSFNGGDAAIEGADYLATQGVDWSNAGFAFHGYTGLGSIEDTIAPFKTSTSYPALHCTEFWPGDTLNGYNAAFESHHIGWTQFEWLAANDVDLGSLAYKLEQAGTVWTPDLATATWPASGSPAIPASGSAIGIYHRGSSAFLSADGSGVEANLATYTGSQNDMFIVQDAGDGMVAFQASNGLYLTATDEATPMTASAASIGETEKFIWHELPNGDVTFRSYGGGGHLWGAFARGKNAGKFAPLGDDALSGPSTYAIVDGSAPSGPPADPPPPPAPEPGPFYGTPIDVPATIAAADFDHGGEGVAYSDTEAENFGGAYRPEEGVDIQGSSEGGTNVGWIEGQEWMHYTVNVVTAGDYTLTARVASSGGGGPFHFEFDGINKTGNMTAPDTGGWQNWTNVSATVSLSAGVQVMKFDAGNGGFNMKDITISEGGAPPPPSGDTDVYVASIVMSTSQAGGNRTNGVAVVTIKDADGNNVSGASVSGSWSGLATSSSTGTTGTDGRATFSSALVRNANGTFTFTVDDVTGTGLVYNSSLNVETSDSITVP